MITVYVLQGESRRYVGITNNLERRLREHSTTSHSGKLIGHFTVLQLETFPDYATARVREKFLKSGQGREWLNQQHGSQLRKRSGACPPQADSNAPTARKSHQPDHFSPDAAAFLRSIAL
jgi:predicted GIY-YIG superfamily endonuclease